MTAEWVVCLLLLLIDGPVPVVRADDSPFQLGIVPSTFMPGNQYDSGVRFTDLITPSVFDWYGYAGVAFLDRTMHSANFGTSLGAIQSTGQGNSFIDLNPNDNHLITTGDLNSGPTPGLRFLIGRTIWTDPCDDRGCVAKNDDMPEPMRTLSLELGYLGLLQQQSTVRYNANPAVPNGTIVSRLANVSNDGTYTPVLWPFDNANTNTLTYRSRFDSAELNLRYTTANSGRMPIDVLAGIRYLKWQENLDLQASNTISHLPTPYGAYSTRTDNDLIGLQVGSDLSYRLTSAWSLIGRGRGGLLVNSASQRNNLNGTLVASSLPLNDTGAASGVGFAGLFEFGIHTNYQLTSNLSLMVGYQGLYLSDLSTAPRQGLWNPELTNRNTLDRNGSLFFFGPAAGIEWRW
ncbi:MAG TPA: Lpg1974 family pore-forming outer membrane protein [Gemmatales bacterium]|nr:Lpg1974 family pore-forming outer membrane protein [Gemmatales bacterium]